MSAVSKMTMRMDVQRDNSTGTTSWGGKEIPTFVDHLISQRCWVWSKTKRDVTDEGKIALLQDVRALIPLGVDIAERDRIIAVKNRLGTTVFPGNYSVITVEPRKTHQELLLEKAA